MAKYVYDLNHDLSQANCVSGPVSIHPSPFSVEVIYDISSDATAWLEYNSNFEGEWNKDAETETVLDSGNTSVTIRDAKGYPMYTQARLVVSGTAGTVTKLIFLT